MVFRVDEWVVSFPESRSIAQPGMVLPCLCVFLYFSLYSWSLTSSFYSPRFLIFQLFFTLFIHIYDRIPTHAILKTSKYPTHLPISSLSFSPLAHFLFFSFSSLAHFSFFSFTFSTAFPAFRSSLHALFSSPLPISSSDTSASFLSSTIRIPPFHLLPKPPHLAHSH